MIKLTLPGSIRSKKNSKQPIGVPSKTGKSTFYRYIKGLLTPVRIILLPSSAYKKWESETKADAQIKIMQQGGRGTLFNEKIHVKAIFYYKGARPDLSGSEESLGDCLEGVAYANDRQIESWDGSRMVHDLKNPRTEVWISRHEEELI